MDPETLDDKKLHIYIQCMLLEFFFFLTNTGAKAYVLLEFRVIEVNGTKKKTDQEPITCQAHE